MIAVYHFQSDIITSILFSYKVASIIVNSNDCVDILIADNWFARQFVDRILIMDTLRPQLPNSLLDGRRSRCLPSEIRLVITWINNNMY